MGYISIATVGMIIAQIIRRVQLLKLGQPDYFPVPGYEILVKADINEEDNDVARVVSPDLARNLEEANNITNQNRALLRVVSLLEKGNIYIYIYALWWRERRRRKRKKYIFEIG